MQDLCVRLYLISEKNGGQILQIYRNIIVCG